LINVENKSHLVTFFIIFYGAIAVPAYWLKDYKLSHFHALMALYVVYAIITYILSSLLCMYIPHCMRIAGEKDGTPTDPAGTQQVLHTEATAPKNETKIIFEESNAFTDATEKSTTHRKYGFRMSILGGIGTTVGGILGLILVIILAQTLPADQRQTSGLLVTTVVGFITLAGSVVAYFGLPIVPPKPDGNWKTWWLELLTPLRDLLYRKNMLVLLLSYTIYVDTVFALSSVTGQLYFIEVAPDALEYSLYTLAGSLFQLVCSLGFFFLQIYRPPFNLERWLIIGYGLIIIIPIWGCIGLARNIDFGLKVRSQLFFYKIDKLS
jgi:hypothetical protein